MTTRYRDFQISDFSRQNDLFIQSFPETSGSPTSSPEHYHWKFQSFPFQTSSYQFIAEDNNDLLGFYGAIPYPYVIHGKEVRCGMVCDVMTHPKARGKGIFTQIGFYSTERLKQENISFTSGYPIRPEVIPGHLKVGWKIVLSLPMYMRVLRSEHLIPLKSFKFLAPLMDIVFSTINTIANLFTNTSISVDILSRKQFLEMSDYEQFFEKWRGQQINYLLKQKPFLEWRTGAPQTEYLFFVLRGHDEITAIAITRRVVLKGIPVVAILDLMALEGFNMSPLHQKIYNFAKQNGDHGVVSMISKSGAKKYAFFKNAYLPTPAVFKLIIKNLQNGLDDKSLFNEQDWQLMWIDSDDL